MIKVTDLTYGVPTKDLYKDISFTLELGSHCALIGSNGTGKSTLADMLINPDDYMFDGTISRADDIRTGFAKQFSSEEKNSDMTVFEYLSADFVKVQQDIVTICEEMATAEDMDAAFAKYTAVMDLNEAMDGDNYESNIHKELHVAGMLDVKNTRLADISGGEYKIIQIVKEMLLKPDLLVLDEPDAFLDFDNLNSLCKLINNYSGTILVVTHNRYLLSHCFNKILHLEGMALMEYNGKYFEYRCEQLRQKLELRKQYEDEQEEIERTEEMVQRMRKRATLMINPGLGRTVNAKQSQLDRLIARQIDEPFLRMREPVIQFPRVTALNDSAPTLTVTDYSVAFDESILENVNFEVMPGEKIAIVGANGTGKTTLVRDIISGHPAIKINPDVKFACLSQIHTDDFDTSKTVYAMMQDKNYGSIPDIERHLRKYALTDIDIHKQIDTLSIGEQNLLQIATLSNSGAEFLILDEPTSHLDVYTQTALEAAINDFAGTVLLISHDFNLISNTMDYVLLIEDNTIRRTRTKKFRKMVYDKYFDQKELELDNKRKQIEQDINEAYKKGDLEKVEALCDELEA